MQGAYGFDDGAKLPNYVGFIPDVSAATQCGPADKIALRKIACSRRVGDHLSFFGGHSKVNDFYLPILFGDSCK